MSRLAPCYLLMVLFSLVAGAQDLYTGVVPVEGQDASERARRVPDALVQVLQKQSGLYDLPLHPALDQALADASTMLISFQYLRHEWPLPDGSVQSELQLAARFSPAAVDRVVRDMGLPRWRHERRPIVLWVVIDDGSGRALMPIEYRYAWQRMEAVAESRGLPVAWPGLSEELQQQVDLQLLWGGYTDQLLAEGADSDGVVIAAARREGPEWNVRWTFADARASSGWRTRAPELTQALAEGTHQLTNLVASVNSIGPAGLGDWQVEMRVAGMRTGEDYARCLAYLQGLTLVEQVAVLGAGPQGFRFRLDLNAEPAYLQRALVQDRVLEPGGRDGEYRLLR